MEHSYALHMHMPLLALPLTDTWIPVLSKYTGTLTLNVMNTFYEAAFGPDVSDIHIHIYHF